jgi:hypothetical protein
MAFRASVNSTAISGCSATLQGRIRVHCFEHTMTESSERGGEIAPIGIVLDQQRHFPSAIGKGGV